MASAYSKQSDRQLISSLQRGELKAFDELYGRYARKVLAYAKTFFWDKTEAEEVVQEIFVKVWETRAKLDPELSFSSFLYTCVKNKIYSKLKAQKKTVFVADTELEALVDESGHEEQVAHESRRQVAFHLLGLLPPVQQNIFTLSKLEGRSHQEIADMLNISIRTVEHHIYLAKKQLKAQLLEQSPYALVVGLSLLA
ncbi:RNA polymerase sigma-70 factor [Algoriphagus aestuariicola]|uniref:RNA polymerase sigma-70 factor n=1 Tax=Algoriphagus aestuariicola TaxID=1852016 RepID=A0ABS3BSX8_9BACT|nr:RNA polymerase sigma-70 factor [Algoriphagus aestuariicola]MBN7802413.1 RNA polymerase sigma-70 factor [Algoriphagus aestuariicola]